MELKQITITSSPAKPGTVCEYSSAHLVDDRPAVEVIYMGVLAGNTPVCDVCSVFYRNQVAQINAYRKS